jgi:hypothetical protein
VLTRDAQQSATGHEAGQLRAAGEELRNDWRCVNNMLEVVKNKQDIFLV